MASELQNSANQGLVVEELAYVDGFAEEDLTSVAYLCTCTCSDDGPLQQAP